MKRWTAVRVRRPRDRAAIVSALFELGAEGVQETDDEIITHLHDADRSNIDGALRRVDPTAAIGFDETPDVDWSSAWRSRIGAHSVGPLVVTPPWLAERYPAETRVIIDPGMAFGTGEHETTRGVLRLLARFLRTGDTVADLGAGSAILSIAAARLGASRAVAIELDPEAIGNAQENIDRNEVAGRVHLLEGDATMLLPLVAPVRVVVANIISSVLLTLLPTIAAALSPGGFAILSGILAEERSSIEKAIGDGGWRVLAFDEEGMWWSVAIARS